MEDEISKAITYWMTTAEQDYETAKVLFDKEKYTWCLFLGHIVVEKLLKALWVKSTGNTVPPRTHNLLLIADKCNLNLTSSDRTELLRITEFNMEARYPDEKLAFYKICDVSFTEQQFRVIEKWRNKLLKQLKS